MTERLTWEALYTEREQMRRERDEARAEVERLRAELDTAKTTLVELAKWRDKGPMLRRERDEARAALHTADAALSAVLRQRDHLRAQLDLALAWGAEACELLEEREADMHARIRAGYDKTVADSWRAALKKVEADRDDARAALRRVLDAANEPCECDDAGECDRCVELTRAALAAAGGRE